jgi:CRISPR-associated protein Csc2
MSLHTTLAPFFTTTDALLHTATAEGKTYAQPALKNLGAVAIPVLREVIAPASFRNADAEITDIAVDGVRRIRAVANKFKYGERSRGAQVLRLFKAGANMAQNRTHFEAKDAPSKGYDLNTIVFGDSANRDKYVLPVKAAAQYSDAVSLSPYDLCVEATFHNRAAEDGTLFDAEKKANSVNIFERHFILPGTLLLQVITFNGRTAPIEALDHLLLGVGLAGAYGGQTSIYGVNVRNHVVGVYAGKFEQAIASPYQAIAALGEAAEGISVKEALKALHEIYLGAYQAHVDAKQVAAHQGELIAKVEKADTQLAASYKATQAKVGEFFNAWFGMA